MAELRGLDGPGGDAVPVVSLVVGAVPVDLLGGAGSTMLVLARPAECCAGGTAMLVVARPAVGRELGSADSAELGSAESGEPACARARLPEVQPAMHSVPRATRTATG